MSRSEEAYLASEALHLPRLGLKREYKLQARHGRQLQEIGYVTDPWTISRCDLTEGHCRMSVAQRYYVSMARIIHNNKYSSNQLGSSFDVRSGFGCGGDLTALVGSVEPSRIQR
jgi:hypothetical protein